MRKLFFISLYFALTTAVSPAFAQKDTAKEKQQANIKKEFKGILCYATVVNGDTIPLVYMKAAYVITDRVFKNQFQAWKYGRLVHNVKVVYPYAKIAGIKIKQYKKMLVGVTSEDEKHRMMKKVESELKSQFGKEMKELTISQGAILFKLIDRETGNTSYHLIEEMRGAFSATLWQAVARVFDNNLKSEYDPAGDDKKIEDIVSLIERGQL